MSQTYRINVTCQHKFGASEALIEQCAKIAEPWAGFWPQDNATEIDKAVISVRADIAAKIRSLAAQPPAAPVEAGCPHSFGMTIRHRTRLAIAGDIRRDFS